MATNALRHYQHFTENKASEGNYAQFIREAEQSKPYEKNFELPGVFCNRPKLLLVPVIGLNRVREGPFGEGEDSRNQGAGGL